MVDDPASGDEVNAAAHAALEARRLVEAKAWGTQMHLIRLPGSQEMVAAEGRKRGLKLTHSYVSLLESGDRVKADPHWRAVYEQAARAASAAALEANGEYDAERTRALELLTGTTSGTAGTAETAKPEPDATYRSVGGAATGSGSGGPAISGNALRVYGPLTIGQDEGQWKALEAMITRIVRAELRAYQERRPGGRPGGTREATGDDESE